VPAAFSPRLAKVRLLELLVEVLVQLVGKQSASARGA
jgi:hypothetical protein